VKKPVANQVRRSTVQYHDSLMTPMHLAWLIADLIRPQLGERIIDPTCGVGNLLVSASIGGPIEVPSLGTEPPGSQGTVSALALRTALKWVSRELKRIGEPWKQWLARISLHPDGRVMRVKPWLKRLLIPRHSMIRRRSPSHFLEEVTAVSGHALC